MALILIENPPSVLVVSGDWTDFVAREDKSNIGTGLSIPIFTLTNWDGSTTKPQIAEGSIIEVGGSIYQSDADTALTDEGGLTNGTVHIKLVPAGGGATVVPTLTNDSIPSWDAVKGGWYDSDDKFLPFEMEKASAVYTVKSELINQNKTNSIGSDGGINTDNSLLKTKILKIGVWNMQSTNFVQIAHGGTLNKIRRASALVFSDNSAALYNMEGSSSSAEVDGTLLSSTTLITLTRYSGKRFDNAGFSALATNRGWITIEYEV